MNDLNTNKKRYLIKVTTLSLYLVVSSRLRDAIMAVALATTTLKAARF